MECKEVNREAYSKPLSEDEKRIFASYGRRPSAGAGLLRPRSHERKYFDSGDFALSAAQRVTEDGAIQTGKKHPERGSISHPYAPVPNTSNANCDANKDINEEKKTSGPEIEGSHLRQKTDSEDEKPQD